MKLGIIAERHRPSGCDHREEEVGRSGLKKEETEVRSRGRGNSFCISDVDSNGAKKKEKSESERMRDKRKVSERCLGRRVVNKKRDRSSRAKLVVWREWIRSSSCSRTSKTREKEESACNLSQLFALTEARTNKNQIFSMCIHPLPVTARLDSI